MAYRKLKAKIVELYGTQDKFAKAIHSSRDTVSTKLYQKANFSQHDIVVWSRALNIDLSEVGYYFYAPEVWKSLKNDER